HQGLRSRWVRIRAYTFTFWPCVVTKMIRRGCNLVHKSEVSSPRSGLQPLVPPSHLGSQHPAPAGSCPQHTSRVIDTSEVSLHRKVRGELPATPMQSEGHR